METLKDLIGRHAQDGRIAALILRPARRAEPVLAEAAQRTAAGLAGDHARPGKRALTMIQAEHLPAIAAFAGLDAVLPELLRRNLVVSGINLGALRGRTLRIGASAVIEITGPCAPCSRMEAALGHGGYTAMRGHGGWCACVLRPGPIGLGDQIRPG